MFQFKLNEFGLMEMLTEDSPQAGKTVVDSAVGVNTTDFTVTTSQTSDRGAIWSLEVCVCLYVMCLRVCVGGVLVYVVCVSVCLCLWGCVGVFF